MLTDELARAQVRSRSQLTSSYHTSSTTQSDNLYSIYAMADSQYSKLIDSIPTFSGNPHENINQWLGIVSLKFYIIGYDSRQKCRFIPQYLTGSALQWYLAHCSELSSWDKELAAITSAFPDLITTSRDMNLKLLRDRKQADTEPFIDYYTSIIDLCRKHAHNMPDIQIDRLAKSWDENYIV
ncbi:unnamed protein product [Rotaria sp. Silwood2]|nr:unnamed protein product [Rotaria sp. Silwood2]CAF3144975.1 unnamed protein product [Rotaria sp. Silwood2]CAF3396287.1 unnamed protein product [Rotaria sp. Silwood2]CAF3399060.1 unnamed protein product [Rotaria sp. Silwood2]CAF4409327.1 unnamed protein product [Rotaria sp. Silwood2]